LHLTDVANKYSDWLGILNTFRTKYHPDIISLIPQIKLIKEGFAWVVK